MMPTFLFCLAGGMLFVLGCGKIELTAWRFHRVVGLLVTAIATLPTVLLFQVSVRSMTAWLGVVCTAAAVAISVIAVRQPEPTAKPGAGAKSFATMFRAVCGVGAIAGFAACVTHLLARSMADATALIRVGAAISCVLGGWLLGAITTAWLLGHAYLTATRMTIAPLLQFSKVLNVAIAARVAFVGASLLVAWWLQPQLAPGDGGVVARLSGAWLILSLRIGVGVVGVAVLTYMVSDCVRLRSTQSATGILYFGSTFAYIGELASQYLLLETSWPM